MIFSRWLAVFTSQNVLNIFKTFYEVKTEATLRKSYKYILNIYSIKIYFN